MFLMSGPACRAMAEESRALRQVSNQNTGVAQATPDCAALRALRAGIKSNLQPVAVGFRRIVKWPVALFVRSGILVRITRADLRYSR